MACSFFLRFSLPSVLLILASSYEVPEGYSLQDSSADHSGIAKKLAQGGRLVDSVASFQAACRFGGRGTDFMNLGVAFMRQDQLAKAWKAFGEAKIRKAPEEKLTKNADALLQYASKKGYTKDNLVQMSRDLKIDEDLGIQSADESSDVSKEEEKDDFQYDTRGGASDFEANRKELKILQDGESVAKRGLDFMARGEKSLGRGFLSLALHMNPFLPKIQPDLVSAIRDEKKSYWKGNLFGGYDKTSIESVIPKMSDKYQMGIWSWRNLELTRLSCCGIDNLAVFFSLAPKGGHPYIIPFLHLIPGYHKRLKQDNVGMYTSFLQWHTQSGSPPMPSPTIKHLGKGHFEWDVMKVALPAKRIPVGWPELTEAVLLKGIHDLNGMREAAYAALAKNDELGVILDELLPELSLLPTPRHPAFRSPSVEQKYVICYNPHVGLGNIVVVMVSALRLAKLTGRTFLLHWNTNVVSRHAFQLRDQPNVHLISDKAHEAGIVHESGQVRDIYFFHITDNDRLTEELELLGCSDMKKELDKHAVVTVSSNLYFAPLLALNPHTPKDSVPDFPDALADMFAPNPKAVRRALAYANKTEWAIHRPVIGIHIRAREKGEDNDDWPTHDAPSAEVLKHLWRCTEKAVERELGDISEWDVYVSATTEKARKAVGDAVMKNAKGVKRLLGLPNLDRNRRTGSGAVDAMAESLLLSRSEVFVRVVVGTQGFSTFAYLTNALRVNSAWASSLPPLRAGTEKYMPNYLVTKDCGRGECFTASPELRMADISWHGEEVTKRSCGDQVRRMQGEDVKCGHVLETIF